MTKNNDPLLKTSEVKKMLNVSRDKVLQMCKSGDLKFTQLGPKTIRIFKSSVLELIAEGVNNG